MDARIKRRLRPLFSTVAIGIFIFLAFASFGPDGSTNTMVAISNCESKPPITVQVRVSVYIKDSDGLGVPGATGRIYAVHQKINSDTSCTFTHVTESGNFITGNDGLFQFEGQTFMHDNSQDLFRVEIVTDDGQNPYFYFGERETQVKYYDSGDFTFNFEAYRIL